MTLAIPAFRHLRNAVIALVIALTITLAPIVRADTIKFVRSVFGFADIGARQPAAVVKADLTH
ncbi:MAG: hypothetical protein MUC34_04465 [Anaerolineae bacterium]|jgi:hypothetical protein|nr:hypothetical protein [Anaerolineae bacterium]